MSAYLFRKDIPPQWDTECQKDGALFHSRDWQALLEDSFGCRSLYSWDAGQNTGASISVFKVGPFNVGFLGFPVGGTIGNTPPEMARWLALRESPGAELPTCIRIAASAFAEPTKLALPYASNPETAICDLQNWNLSSVSKNLRRDVRKAKRSSLSVDKPTDSSEGSDLYRIYRATVINRGGALRYNENYFSGLINLAEQQSGLRILIARHQGNVAGFIAVGTHGKTSYYLHGGTDIAYRQYSPADLLLNEAIHLAQEAGSECFNLMSSPNDQPSLVKYKEKWGGETREHKTFTLAIRTTYVFFAMAEKLYRLFR